MQRGYKEIAKQLIPTTLFPTDKEYQTAVEDFLSKNAPHYINELGRNNWLSKFKEKILPEVSESQIFNNNQKASDFFLQL